MKARLRALLALAAMIPLFSLNATQALASGIAVPSIEDRTDNAIVVEGMVENDGKPVPADVLMRAWPRDDVHKALKVGEQIPVIDIARTSTGDDGQFELSLDPDAVPATHVSKSGAVHFEVLIADNESTLTFARTLYVPKSGAPAWRVSSSADEIVDHQGATSLQFDTGRGEIRDSMTDIDAGMTIDGNALIQGPASIPASATKIPATSVTPVPRAEMFDRLWNEPAGRDSGDPCAWYAGLLAHGEEYFAIARGAENAAVEISQEVESTHTLGVGSKLGGFWEQSGTTTHTSSSRGSKPHTTDSLFWANKVNYRQGYNPCINGGGTSRLTPIGLNALFTNSFRTTTNWPVETYCEPYEDGVYAKVEGVNITFSGELTGVQIDLAGTAISLTAQSGWNSTTTIEWIIDGPAYLCGNQPGIGWASSQFAVAQER